MVEKKLHRFGENRHRQFVLTGKRMQKMKVFSPFVVFGDLPTNTK